MIIFLVFNESEYNTIIKGAAFPSPVQGAFKNGFIRNIKILLISIIYRLYTVSLCLKLFQSDL